MVPSLTRDTSAARSTACSQLKRSDNNEAGCACGQQFAAAWSPTHASRQAQTSARAGRAPPGPAHGLTSPREGFFLKRSLRVGTGGARPRTRAVIHARVGAHGGSGRSRDPESRGLSHA
jgi:hypothetical protein